MDSISGGHVGIKVSLVFGSYFKTHRDQDEQGDEDSALVHPLRPNFHLLCLHQQLAYLQLKQVQ